MQVCHATSHVAGKVTYILPHSELDSSAANESGMREKTNTRRINGYRAVPTPVAAQRRD